MKSQASRIFATVLILASCLPTFANAVQVDNNRCQRLFFAIAVTPSLSFLKGFKKPSFELPIAPGKELNYSVQSRWFSGYTRYEEVFLNVRRENLKDISEALAQRRETESVETALKIRLGETAEAEIPLSSILPRFAKEKTNTFCRGSGPNCRNATDNWNEYHGISPMSSADLDFQLQTNYIKIVSGEELRFGDTIVVRRGRTIDHAAIYINEEVLWHKASSEPTEPWTFESLTGHSHSMGLSNQ